MGRLRRMQRMFPQPWRSYIWCHGTLRSCYWFPRWRDAIRCRVVGHDWDNWLHDGDAVMCSHCAAGPVYKDDDEGFAGLDITPTALRNLPT